MAPISDDAAAAIEGATPHGVTDVLLSGTHHTPADQAAAKLLHELNPDDPAAVAVAERAFMRRALRHVAYTGVKQYLDLGCGTLNTGHAGDEVRKIIPDAKVVYVDIDPDCVAIVNEQIAGDPLSVAVQGDIAWPGPIITQRPVRRLFNWAEPVCVILNGSMAHVPDVEHPDRRVKEWRARCVTGSYVILSHPTGDYQPEERLEPIRDLYRRMGMPIHFRPKSVLEHWVWPWHIVHPYEGAPRAEATSLDMFATINPTDSDDAPARWGYGLVAERAQIMTNDLEFNPHIASPARMYDYYLGGGTNFPADVEAAAKVVEAMPTVPAAAKANRRFLIRGLQRMMRHHNIIQLLDLGCGLPTERNTATEALEINAQAKVVCVDIDPIVAAHSKQLLDASPNIRLVTCDFRDSDLIMRNSEYRAVISTSKPIGTMMVAILHFLEDPFPTIREYAQYLPPGSILLISHATRDGLDPESVAEVEDVYSSKATTGIYFRTKAEILDLFERAGFTILPSNASGACEPVLLNEFWPDPDDPDPEDVVEGSKVLAGLMVQKPFEDI